MKQIKIFIGLLLLLMLSINIFAEPCPAYRQDCIMDQQASKFDIAMYDFSLTLSNMFFFEPNSLLRTSTYQNNTVASYLNLTVIKILAIFFQFWYIVIIYKFSSSRGDLEKIKSANDSLKRFLFALATIAISAILFTIFSSFMGALNATIADTGGVQDIFAPNPNEVNALTGELKYDPNDSGIISGILRFFLIIGMILLLIPLVFFKMAESLLLPLFTLFLFLHFANRKVASSLIFDLLVYAMLLPGIFFLILMVFNSLFSFMIFGLKTAIVIGILAVCVTGIVFIFIIIKLSLGAIARSLILQVSGAVFQGISKGLRKAYKK